MVNYPECAAEIDLPEDTIQNEILDCPTCGLELEVVSLDPAEFDLAPGEDWGE